MKLIQCVLTILIFVSFTVAQDKVLAKGEPPLTQAMVDRARDFLEWLFEAPLTAEQRTTVEVSIVSSWTNSKKEEIAGTLELIKSAEQIAQLPDEARASVRAQIQPEVVAGLRGESDPASKWMLSIYDAAHKPIAPGKPPLTRQMSDAQAEMFAFIIGEAAGQKVVTDKKFLNEWARSLVSTYAKMNEVQQKQIARAPIDWANLRFGWSRMNEQQRSESRKLWQIEFQTIIPESASQQKVNAALGRVEQILKGKTLDQVTAAQLNEVAKELDIAAKALGAEQSAESKKMIAQIKQTAAEFRNAAAAKNQPGATSKTSANVSKTMQQLQANQDSFRNMMNMSMQMNYSRVNSTNILGGNPYRYVNSFGNPY
jgi:hypothetical protein